MIFYNKNHIVASLSMDALHGKLCHCAVADQIDNLILNLIYHNIIWYPRRPETKFFGLQILSGDKTMHRSQSPLMGLIVTLLSQDM